MLLKVAIRGGHNFLAVGAEGLLKEVVEDRKILVAAIKYLKLGGAEVLDVTPGNMSTSQDLAYGVNKANAWGADVFVSIHLNKAYDSYNGALGTECLVYSLDNEYAKRIVNNIASLGFKNRGLKVKPDYYEPKYTNMKAVIAEAFFCEATEDVELYKKVGPDAIGKAIAEGILNKKINEPVKEEVKIMNDIYVCYGNDVDKRAAEYLVDYYKGLGKTVQLIDSRNPWHYDKAAKEIIAVGGGDMFSGYTTKRIIGSDRYETLKLVIKHMGKL